MRMMCFGNSLSDRGSLYNVVDIVPFGLYNPPENLVNYAKVTNVVPLQANLQDYWKVRYIFEKSSNFTAK